MTFDRLRAILRLRVRSLLFGASVDRELDAELRDHLERQIEADVAGGMRPEEARRVALIRMGGVEQRKEQCRDERGISVVENLLRDLRLALRQLRKQPGFTVTAIVSLALGIGANTAMFQLLNALTLRTLPVSAPHELVEVRLTGEGRSGRHTGRNRQVSLPQFRAIDRRQEAFSSLLAFSDMRFNLAPAGEVRYVDGLWVSGTFFDTLGVPPLIGRLLGPADDTPGCGSSAPSAVISHSMWQSEFGGRADVLTQTLPLGGTRVPIVGVTPPSFYGVEVGRQFSVALPLCMSGIERNDHWWLAVIGRLKPGWTKETAAAQLARVFHDVQQETMPDYDAAAAADYLAMRITTEDASAGVSPLRRQYQDPLWVLLAISAMVLLMAAVNLGNLLLARASARQSEFAVRLALGGGPRRILQQVLVESALLAVLGAIAALGVAWAISRSIPPLISTAVDRIHLDLALDWRVYGFMSAVAGAATLIFGGAPALRAARTRILGGATRGAAANEGMRLRRALVSLQIAVTLVLLFGGTLFLRSFSNLASVDTGVHERGIVAPVVFFSDRAYPVERRREAYRRLDERIRSLPGVISATDAYTTPLGGSIWDTDIESDEKKTGPTNGNRVGPGYFATLGTRFIAGRDFDARDVPGSPRVAIVSESFAAAFFTGDPIGRHFRIPGDDGGPGVSYDVIGVVEDQTYVDLRAAQTRIMFLASAQEPLPLSRRYVIRAAMPPQQTVAAVTAALAAFDPRLAVRFDMLDAQIGQGMLRERLMARVSMIFGSVALLLAVVGLYGVVSYGVASRRAEIGVRVALGAGRPRILRMILADVGKVLMVGVAAGGVLAVAAGRGVGSMLFGVASYDPATMGIAVLILIVSGLLSAAWPARRAARIDPVTVLRES